MVLPKKKKKKLIGKMTRELKPFKPRSSSPIKQIFDVTSDQNFKPYIYTFLKQIAAEEKV